MTVAGQDVQAAPQAPTGGRRWVKALPRRVRAAVVLLAIAAVAACSTGGAGDSSDSGGGSSAAQADAAASVAGDAVGRTVADGEPSTQAVIRTASVTLVADDLEKLRRQLDERLTRWHGYVADEETDHDRGGRTRSSYLTLRVPAARLDRLLADLARLGRVRTTMRQERDVTDQTVDLDARIRTTRQSLRRLRGFLAKATDVNALVRLESAIADREGTLDSLTGRRDRLAGQVALATVRLEATLPGTRPAPDDAGFLAGLRTGWRALGDVVVVAATAVGALLPFALVLAVVGGPIALAIRAARRRRTVPSEAP